MLTKIPAVRSIRRIMGAASTRYVCCALASLIGCGPLSAGDVLIPYAIVQAEHNSNVFDQSDLEQQQVIPPGGGPTALDILLNQLFGTPLPLPQQSAIDSGDTQRDDQILRYIAGIEIKLPLASQRLRAVLEARRLDYSHFNRLDHDEHLVSAGLDWRLNRIIDGLLDYRQERRMAAFSERNSTSLAIEDERIASGSANLQVTPDWRLVGGLRSRQLDSPLPAFPEFSLQERTISAAVKYVGMDSLAAGLLAEYLDGEFEGVAATGQFDQQSLSLTAEYSASDLSRFGAELGYTQRQEAAAGSDKQAEVTGAISYRRELSGKTTADARVFRRVRSFVGAASSVVETGAGVGLAWQPTDRISLLAAYQMSQGSFQDASAAGNGRRDDDELASLKLTYQVLPSLALRPYAEYRSRDSSTGFDSFDTKIVGIELRLRFE